MHVNPDRPPDAAVLVLNWRTSETRVSDALNAPALVSGLFFPPAGDAAPSRGVTVCRAVNRDDLFFLPPSSSSSSSSAQHCCSVAAIDTRWWWFRLRRDREACGPFDPPPMVLTSWVFMLATESGRNLPRIENGTCLFHGWLVHFFSELYAQVSRWMCFPSLSGRSSRTETSL